MRRVGIHLLSCVLGLGTAALTIAAGGERLVGQIEAAEGFPGRRLEGQSADRFEIEPLGESRKQKLHSRSRAAVGAVSPRARLALRLLAKAQAC